MFPAWLLFAIALGYVGLLFAVAQWSDHNRTVLSGRRAQAIVYSLSLAVYCTSWTFFGAVGTAAATGWGFLPIYLGPALVFVFGWSFLRRVARISKERNITSIADFISSRFGKSRALAILVTAIAVSGAIPYIALQLKAISMGLDLLTIDAQTSIHTTALYVAIFLALFSVLFGTRQIDATEHHRGMMWAIATESVVKLLAFLAVGVFALTVIWGDGTPVAGSSGVADQTFQWSTLPGGFLTQTLLAGVAIFCLPRQFHVAFVEYSDAKDLRLARWVFPLYLGLISILVVPITIAGLSKLGSGTNPDTFVLALPAADGHSLLTILSFLGGFSAATGMVIVATVAMATMISNEVILPVLLRWQRRGFGITGDFTRVLLLSRRATIVLIALVSYLYYRFTFSTETLASIGLLSFAAVAQFAPAVVMGVYWRGATREGALAGLWAGFLMWGYTLFLPELFGHGTHTWLATGPFGLEWLSPYALLGSTSSPLTHGVVWSLGVNAGLLVAVSLARRPSRADKQEARAIIHGGTRAIGTRALPAGMETTVGDLASLASRFVGGAQARNAFEGYGDDNRQPLRDSQPADRDLIHFTEVLLAGSIGAASARNVLSSALKRHGLGQHDLTTVFTEASQAARFHRHLLESTLDSIPQGISVVDEELHLVGWNNAYLELFDYPPQMIHIGRSVADLIRYNADRGLCGPGDTKSHVRKRLAHMRAGDEYTFERRWANGRVLEMRGNPMPGGGYVTTFTDVTAYKRTEEALQEVNETLEQRVELRTDELEQAIDAMRAAKAEAEDANQAKTRFLAAASHDLLQPMNAARLFASVLVERAEELTHEHAELVRRIDASLHGAEDLLGALLDISKLDRGVLEPEISEFPLSELFDRLDAQFQTDSGEMPLRVRVRPTKLWVRSDRQMLQRVLQNFVSNALRYTEAGGLLVGVRRCGETARIGVWDTGPGIPPESRALIFEEFKRLNIKTRGQQGLGLGLAISDRMANMLGHEIGLKSVPGRGSCFSIVVPVVPAVDRPATAPARRSLDKLDGVSVLCIDNEQAILDGMHALLTRWGCQVQGALGRDDALALVSEPYSPDVVLADYHLNADEKGIDVVDDLKSRGLEFRTVIVSADRSESLQGIVKERDYGFIRKPVRPARLRALMTRLLRV